MVCEEQAQDLLRAAYSHLCPAPNREVAIVMVQSPFHSFLS